MIFLVIKSLFLCILISNANRRHKMLITILHTQLNYEWIIYFSYYFFFRIWTTTFHDRPYFFFFRMNILFTLSLSFSHYSKLNKNRIFFSTFETDVRFLSVFFFCNILFCFSFFSLSHLLIYTQIQYEIGREREKPKKPEGKKILWGKI